MFCNKCGKELKDDAKFCTDCGCRIEKTDDVQFSKPNEINTDSDSGSEKTVYLPAEDENKPEETPGQFSFLDDSPTEILHEDEFAAMDITEEDDLSDDPSSVDADPYGESETVVLRRNDTQPQDQQTQSFSQNQQPAFSMSQPVRETVQENDSALNGMNMSVSTSTADTQPAQYNQYNGGYQQQPVGQYVQPEFNGYMQPGGGMPAEIPAAPVKVGKGRIFGASVVALFAVIFLLLLSIIVCVKLGASGSTLNSRIQKLNLNTVLNAEFDGSDVCENIYDTVGFGSATHGNANISDFKEYLKQSDFLEYVGENVENYADFILAGDGKDPSITSEDITYDFFGENNDAADEVFGYTLVKKDLKTIQKNLEGEELDESLSINEWENEIGIGLGSVNYLVSYITIGILAALVLVLLIWIVIIVDKKGRHIMGFFGNTLFISGLVVFICGVAVTVGSMIAFSLTSNVVFYLVSNILLDFGILALIIGFSELLIGFIFKKIGKRLKRKNKLAEETMPVNQNPAPVPAYN